MLLDDIDAAAAPKPRDPRLPKVGTRLRRVMGRHILAVEEQADGTWNSWGDGVLTTGHATIGGALTSAWRATGHLGERSAYDFFRLGKR